MRTTSDMDRVRYGFRADGAGFRASAPTHDISVQRDTMSVTPKHRKDNATITASPLTLRTRDVVRAANSLGGNVSSTFIDATGAIIVDRTEVIEKFENSDDGVEQSWTFEHEPDGSGDLSVQVDVSGHHFASATATGLHFSDGTLGFRYSHATWIDANGTMTRLSARWQNDHIVIVVPEDVLRESVYPAVLDPTVTAEVSADDPVSGTTGVAGSASAIASSGNGFLAVWSDARNGSDDIFGVRLDANGVVLDNFGIAVGKSAATEANATVTFVNGEYLVAWDNGTQVLAARVSPATGAVTQAGTFGTGTQPSCASRGTDALCAFVASGNINTALFSAGTFTSFSTLTSGVVVATPSVGANATGDYLVTWSQGATSPDLMGRFVIGGSTNPGATVTISAGGGSQQEPATAFNGTDFVVVWTNDAADPFGTRVSTTGTVFDTHLEGTTTVGGKAIDLQTGRQLQVSLACATNGTCLTAWSDRRALATVGTDVFGVLLDGSLNQVGGEIAVTGGIIDEQRVPAAAVQGTNFRLSWDDRRDGGGDVIFSAQVNADGSLGTSAAIVRGNNRQVRPDPISSQTTFLVAWSDSRALASDIMAERFKASGARLDATARTISTAARRQNNPRGTFDGTDYLIAWHDNRNGNDDVFAARMTTAGVLLAETPISTQVGDQITPDAATGGGVSLVVWQDGRGGANQDIFGAVVVNGAITVADIPICTMAGLGNQRFPVVSFDAGSSNFVVAWQDDRAGSSQVFAARVTTTGQVLESCGALVSAGARLPSIASGGGQTLITWTDQRTSPTSIFGARVTAGGATLTVVDPAGIPIATGGAGRDEPTVAFSTSGVFAVAWTEAGNIRAQNVAGNGTLAGAAYDISVLPETEARPSLAPAPDGTSLVIAYERDVPSLDTRRVMTRRITFVGGGTGTTCAVASQCASGFCVDGMCCDTACGGGDPTDCQACSTTRGGNINGTCTVITQANFFCRGYAGDGFCDIKEKCDGISTACPDDVGRREGQVCTIQGGGTGTCPANGVIGGSPGASHICQ